MPHSDVWGAIGGALPLLPKIMGLMGASDMKRILKPVSEIASDPKLPGVMKSIAPIKGPVGGVISQMTKVMTPGILNTVSDVLSSNLVQSTLSVSGLSMSISASFLGVVVPKGEEMPEPMSFYLDGIVNSLPPLLDPFKGIQIPGIYDFMDALANETNLFPAITKTLSNQHFMDGFASILKVVLGGGR